MPIFVKKKKFVKYSYGAYCSANGKQQKDYRLTILTAVFIIFAVFLGLRLFKLQILDHRYYVALASGQHEIFRQLYPMRGNIYINNKQAGPFKTSDFYPVALNKDMNLLFAVPSDIGDPEAVLEVLKAVFELEELSEEQLQELEAEIISLEKDINYIKQFIGQDPENEEKNIAFIEKNEPILKQKKDYLEKMQNAAYTIDDWRSKLNKGDDPYEPLKHLISDEQMDQINDFNLEGIHSAPETTRYYPEKKLGSQILGFVGKTSDSKLLKGSYGIEGCYNEELSGELGFVRSEKDTVGRLIATADKDFTSAEDGNDIYLTIDKSIQYFACNELNKALYTYAAEKGSLIIMNPQTGEVIALCNAPEFDPNKYNEVESINIFRNQIIQDAYEPGSIFKPFTLAAAIDSGEVTPFSTYEDTGQVKIDVYTIRNSDLKSNGWQTMTEVLEKSLNTGTVYAARKTGMEKFQSYMQAFGFGQQTGIDLCYEASGNMTSLDKKHDLYLATASFGQGITTTVMQIAKGYSALANKGNLVEPFIIKKIQDKNGNIIKENHTKIIGQAVSEETASQVGGMMVSVVESGHAGKAAVPGYLVAGKTGTAQVAKEGSAGYSDKTIHSFAGYAPLNDPKFVMVVRLDHVQNVPYSSDSAAPLFGKIAKFILDYYQVPKTEITDK